MDDDAFDRALVAMLYFLDVRDEALARAAAGRRAKALLASLASEDRSARAAALGKELARIGAAVEAGSWG